MKNVIAAVKKCRDDNARVMCEDMYMKDSIGNLTKIHSKEDGEENVRRLDSIIERLSAMESETPNAEVRGCQISKLEQGE